MIYTRVRSLAFLLLLHVTHVSLILVNGSSSEGNDVTSPTYTTEETSTTSIDTPTRNITNGCYEDDQGSNCSQTNTSTSNDPPCTETSPMETEDGNFTDTDIVCQPVQSVKIPIWDQGKLSKARYNTGEMVCRYLFIPFVISAVILNIFNIIVYSDVSMRSPTSTYLIALSTNELISAVMSIVRTVLKYIYGSDAVKAQVYLVYIMYVNNPYKSSIRRLMYCFSVLVSTERFFAVAFPLKARNFRLVKSPIVFIVVVTVVCLLCHTPAAFKFNVVQKPNSTDYTIKPSAFYISTGNFLIMLSLVNKIIYTYSLLVVGLTVNFSVLFALNMHSKNRKQMNTSVNEEKAANRERQTTIAILTSSFLFTILALPLATDSVVSSFLPAYNLYNREHYINLLMKEVNDILILFSLSTDFVFYIVLSKAFRRTFFKRIPFVSRLFKRKKQMPTVQPGTQISSISVTNDC